MFNPQVESTNTQLRDITEKFNSGFDIGVLAFLFNKSKWIIISFFTVATILSFLYLRYSQPIYESRATVQINDANRADDILHIDGLNENGNVLAEAIEQIKSRIFLRRVVEKLDIAVNYYTEGTFKNNEMYHSSPYLVKINCKDKSVLGQKIYVELNKSLSAGTLKLGKQQWNFTCNEWLRTPYFDVNVYPNDRVSATIISEVLKENNEYYFVANDIDAVTIKLQGQVEIKLLSELAKTIQIRVRDVNGAKSSDIVNAITEEYMTYDVERKSESSRNILAFIESQLGTVYDALKNTEGDLQRFKKEKNFSDQEVIVNSEFMRNSNLEDEMLKVKIEEDIITEIQRSIQKNKNIDIYQLLSLVSGTEYESVIRETTQNIQRLLNERDNMLYEVTPSSEAIIVQWLRFSSGCQKFPS
jgi:capsular polysaccharide biosynthesis protein